VGRWGSGLCLFSTVFPHVKGQEKSGNTCGKKKSFLSFSQPLKLAALKFSVKVNGW